MEVGEAEGGRASGSPPHSTRFAGPRSQHGLPVAPANMTRPRNSLVDGGRTPRSCTSSDATCWAGDGCTIAAWPAWNPTKLTRHHRSTSVHGGGGARPLTLLLGPRPWAGSGSSEVDAGEEEEGGRVPAANGRWEGEAAPSEGGQAPHGNKRTEQRQRRLGIEVRRAIDNREKLIGHSPCASAEF